MSDIYTDEAGNTLSIGDTVTFQLGKNRPEVEVTELFEKGGKQKVRMSNPKTNKTMVRNASAVLAA
jgi:ribosomal 50S subunit-recycling heat shock protein